MYYDIHNHLFNKSFLARELLYRLMKEMKKIAGIGGRVIPEKKERLKKVKSIIKKLRIYSHAISVFCRKDSSAIFDELDKTYRGEFILTPLTFDLTWCFAPSADRDIFLSPSEAVARDFRREANHFFKTVEAGIRAISPEEQPPDEEELLTIAKYRKEKERFLKKADQLIAADRALPADQGSFRGWNEQIRQLEVMKANPRYKERIFPFLAVDPRRPGIYEYALKNVGKGKLFVGIKLYSPNGYSPTDPLLFGPDGKRGGIYAFCEENGIPVTTHNSLGGFATFAREVVVTGDIHKNGKRISLNQETVKFRSSFLGNNGVYERAMTLNHPLLWEKVVEKYPRLILNLAHFGGGTELERALDNPGDISLWSNKIISLISDPRYQVYTDLSCFTEFKTLGRLKSSPVYQAVRHRILYGSDFTLLLLFESNFNANVRKFKSIFGDDFGIIARENPARFLKYVV